MLLIILCILAAIAIHRIWHYEDIFSYPRTVLFSDPLTTPFLIAPGVASITLFPYAEPILTVLACYPILRGVVWAYDKYDPPIAPCSGCAKKRKEIEELQKTLRSWERRVMLFGFDESEVVKLAKAHPTWVFVTEKAKSLKNIIVREFNKETDTKFIGDVMTVLVNGGNATVITRSCIHTPLWLQVTKFIGGIRGASWVHITDAAHLLTLPQHHRCIAPGASLDTVLKEVKPPAQP